MLTRKRLLSILLLVMPTAFVATANDALAQDARTGKSAARSNQINLLIAATEIRAQSQRVTRLYFERNSPSGGRERAIQRFPRELRALEENVLRAQAAIRTEEQRRAHARIVDRIGQLSSRYSQAFSLTSGEVLYSVADEVQFAAQKLAQLAEEDVRSDYSLALDLVGRTLAQSERIAKAISYCRLTESRATLVDMEIARKEFATSLTQLEELKVNDDYVRENIKLSKQLNILMDTYVSQTLRSSSCGPAKELLGASDAMWEIISSSQDRFEQRMLLAANTNRT
jgi:hypothetical protein